VELAFETRRLRTVCEEPIEAAKDYPPLVVAGLIRRVADIRAADSPLSLVAGSPSLATSGDPQVKVRLASDYILIGVANHQTCPERQDGEIDWARVRRLKIVGIERTEAHARAV
jgi:proteic killer suppression protein